MSLYLLLIELQSFGALPILWLEDILGFIEVLMKLIVITFNSFLLANLHLVAA